MLFNTLFNGLNLKGEKENVLGAEKAGSEVHAVSLVEVPEVDAEDSPDAAGAAPGKTKINNDSDENVKECIGFIFITILFCICVVPLFRETQKSNFMSAFQIIFILHHIKDLLCVRIHSEE